MRLAGLDVELDLQGDLDDLSAGRALTAFRILQEAFTNSLRHAPGSRVRAKLERSPGQLFIEVVDDGGAGSPAPSGRVGYGLIGMRERVALYGGRLDVGPVPSGGYLVAAQIPTGDG